MQSYSPLTDFTFCVVGLGPAGLGAALELANAGLGPQTLCVEAGVHPSQRSCTILKGRSCRYVNPCQIVAGVGGCGALSGGKISTYPAGRGLERHLTAESVPTMLEKAATVIQSYIPLTAPADANQDIAAAEYAALGFTYRHYQALRYSRADYQLGTAAMLERIGDGGVEVRLRTKLTSVTPSSRSIKLDLENPLNAGTISCKALILTSGRTGSNLINDPVLADRLRPTANHLDVGVRLEFPSTAWEAMDAQHGDIKLLFGDARTYCACSNGSLAPYLYEGAFYVEGCSDPTIRTGLSNLAIMLRVSPQEAIALLPEIRARHRAYSGGMPVRDSLLNFLGQSGRVPVRCSITHFVEGSLDGLYPAQISARLRERVAYFAQRILPRNLWPEVSVIGPELDYYWPRIEVREAFATAIPHLYVAGDATGSFRGVLQAFASGMQASRTAMRAL